MKIKLGEYTDSLYISLPEHTKIFNREKQQIVSPSPSKLYSTFIHEVWHHLLNFSTSASLLEFHRIQFLLPKFSKTLTVSDRACSEGSHFFTPEETRELETLEDLVMLYQGDVDLPELEYSASWEIDKIDVTPFSYKLGKSDGLRFLVNLSVLTDSNDRQQSISYRLGAIAVEESLVAEITRMIYPQSSPPDFPYNVIRNLARFMGVANLSSYELAALCTYAMLTLEPGAAILSILAEYSQEQYSHLRISNVEEALQKLWNTNKEKFVETASRAKKELECLKDRYLGRGMSEYATKYLEYRGTKGFEKRLENPLFDLEPFKGSRVDFGKLVELLDEFPPPVILQSLEDLDESAIRDDRGEPVEKDVLVQFLTEDYSWNDTPYGIGEFLVAFACQIEFMKAHSYPGGFRGSSNVESKCPFYTSCSHSKRISNSVVCEKTPWLHFNPSENHPCWYAQGVSGLHWNEVVEKRKSFQ